MRTLDIALISICAALYASIGYLTYLGIFTPVIGVVRFWPAVIIPGVFAALFGPLVGGIGAAIGIFISDMLIHGNALLSLTVGVPANFVCFYLIGYISDKKISWGKFIMLSTLLFIALHVSFVMLINSGLIQHDICIVFIAVVALSYVMLLLISYREREWTGFEIGSFIGLIAGSLIIGIGVWAFSQFFILPTGDINLPLYAAVIWFVWTFATEIPFLTILGPPILKVVKKAIPSVVRY